MVRILKEKLEEYGRVNPKIAKEVSAESDDHYRIWTSCLDQIAIQLPWDYTIRQAGSGVRYSVSQRYEVVVHTLLTEMEMYRIKREFQDKVKARYRQEPEGIYPAGSR